MMFRVCYHEKDEPTIDKLLKFVNADYSDDRFCYWTTDTTDPRWAGMCTIYFSDVRRELDMLRLQLRALVIPTYKYIRVGDDKKNAIIGICPYCEYKFFFDKKGPQIRCPNCGTKSANSPAAKRVWSGHRNRKHKREKLVLDRSVKCAELYLAGCNKDRHIDGPRPRVIRRPAPELISNDPMPEDEFIPVPVPNVVFADPQMAFDPTTAGHPVVVGEELFVKQE